MRVVTLLLLAACSKGAASAAHEREEAVKSLDAQAPPLTFSTRGDDQGILVVHYPTTSFEPCEKPSLEALVRMRPDPERTRDATAPSEGLKDAFKTEITPEMRAKMDAMRTAVSRFRRVECDTKAGVTIGVPTT